MTPPAKFDRSEFLRLKAIVTARAWRGHDQSAVELKRRLSTMSQADQLAVMKLEVVTEKPGGQRKAFNAPWAPSRATQVAALDKRALHEQCVVKSFDEGSIALRRTLALYSLLRETGAEATAPVPRLLKVVQVNGGKGKSNKGGGKDKGRATKAKATAKAKTKQAAGAKPMKKVPLAAMPGQIELWFEYCGPDASRQGVPQSTHRRKFARHLSYSPQGTCYNISRFCSNISKSASATLVQVMPCHGYVHMAAEQIRARAPEVGHAARHHFAPQKMVSGEQLQGPWWPYSRAG